MIKDFLTKNNSNFIPIFKDFNWSDPKTFHFFDFSKKSVFFQKIANSDSVDLISKVIFDEIRENGAKIGVGKYNEERDSYSSANYRDKNENRTIHIGMDLFLPYNTPIIAPIDGIIHSFQNNDIALDFGPTLILKHYNENNKIDFFTLYGHLSKQSLGQFYVDKKIKKGDIIGYIGDSNENGNWTPHLHFQLICDMLDKQGDFIGVAPKSKIKLWNSICPDPNIILNIPNK